MSQNIIVLGAGLVGKAIAIDSDRLTALIIGKKKALGISIVRHHAAAGSQVGEGLSGNRFLAQTEAGAVLHGFFGLDIDHSGNRTASIKS